MSRLTELRERVIRRLETFKESREPRHEIIWGLLGDAAETVAVSGQAAKVNVRLLGNDTNVVRAWNSQVPLVYDLRVDVEVERQEGMPNDYTVLGVARVGYAGYVNDERFFVPPHHTTHEYPPGGGYDIVNVYNRALAELRADAQATPDMTVHISSGFYLTSSAMVLRAAADSPTFAAAPAAGTQRHDLLYLNTTTNQYAITQGDATPEGFSVRPLPTSGQLPIAWIWLQAGDTAITDDMIIDARAYLMPIGALVTSEHPLDPRAAEAKHTGTLGGLHAHASNEDKSGECDGSKTTFLTAQEYVSGLLQIFLNGQLLTLDDDFTEGTFFDAFTMTTAPVAGDALLLAYPAQMV